MVLLVAALALAASGCGFFGSTQQSAQGGGQGGGTSGQGNDSAGQADQSQAAQASSTPVAQGSNTGSTQASTPRPEPEPVASHKTTAENAPLVVKVFPLTRQGELVTLNFSVTNTASGPGVFQWDDIGSFFGDGKTQPSAAVDGVYLISGKNAKKYPVARDSSGNCLCTANLASTDLSKSQTLSFSATFAAPPPEVTAVNVHIPHAGTFTNVPIQ